MCQIKNVMLLHLLSVLLLLGCQRDGHTLKNPTTEEGRKLDSFIKGVMHNYTPYYSKRETDPEYISRVPGAVRPHYLFTVDATYKGDTVRILLTKLWKLVELSKRVGAPTDSLSLVALVKGERQLELNEDAMDRVTVVRKWKSVDSVTKKGKQPTLNYYFRDNGYIKGGLLSNKEEAYLIDRLSDWGILIKQDDESGFYRLEKHYPNTALEIE